MENNTFNVAVLGAGNIGSAVIARLMDLDKGIEGYSLDNLTTYLYTRLLMHTPI